MFRCRLCSAGSLGQVPRLHCSSAALRLLVAPTSLASRFASPFRLAPEATRSHQLLGNPSCTCAGLRPRWRSLAGKDPGRSPCVFACALLLSALFTASASTWLPTIGARCRRPRTRCLRFAVRLPVRLQTPRKTRFRLAVLHPGRSGIAPAGHTESFTSLRDDSLSPAFAGRKNKTRRGRAPAAPQLTGIAGRIGRSPN